MKQAIRLLLLLLLATIPVLAQTTTVTGTVKDANGNAYFPGTVAAQISLAAGQSPPAGVISFTSPTPTTVGGVFSIILSTNYSYFITMCAAPVNIGPTTNPTPKQVCFTSNAILITGISQDLSSILNAIAAQLGPGTGGGGGSGTVTSVGSTGNLSPLLNVTVATPTTTPTFTFSLLNAPPFTIFGNSGGVSGAPFYDTLPDFGIPGLSLSNLFTGLNTFSSTVNLTGENSTGNVALKNAATENIRYASATGNDSNDGLSWGTAKSSIMAAYDSLPGVGGTIYICGNTTNQVLATSTGQGIWIMGLADPNYASPPTGWRQAKAVSFIGACGSDGDQQGTKPTVYIGGIASYNSPGIWISSTQGTQANLDFENLSFRYQNNSVVLGVDSTGAQTNTSGVYGAKFENIVTKMCNPICSSGSGPGWLIGGGDTADIFLDHIVAGGNGQATPGSDNQAAILIEGTSSLSGVNVVITNSVVEDGEIKFYEGNLGSLLTVKDIYSEAINGGSVPVGTVWSASATGAFSHSTYDIENVFTADNIGSVCDLRFDPIAYHEGIITTTNVNSICGDGIQQGSIIGNNLGNRTGQAGDPLTRGLAGFSFGRLYGSSSAAQRPLSSSMIRFTNLAPTSSASWTITGAGGTITTGILAPDGTAGAARVAATSNNITITFYSQSLSLAAGQYFVAGLWQRFNSPDNFYNFNSVTGLQISVAGTGNVVSCSSLLPPGMSTDEWFWSWELCKVTTATTTPAIVTVTSTAPVIGSHRSTIDFYAPVLNNIPASTISNDEVYEYANALVPYNSNCSVGTLCGILGPSTATVSTTGTPANTNLAGFTGPTSISGTSAATLDSSGNVVVNNLTDSTLTPGNCVQATFAGKLVTTGGACGTSSGTVTTTGSPVSGNLSKFSGPTSVTNGDLSGDVTTAGTLATTVAALENIALPTFVSNTGFLFDNAGVLGLSTVPCSQMPALTGDTTSSAASCATSTVKVNGGAVPASSPVLGSNSSSQLVNATVQGNGTKVQLSTGTTTPSDCVQFDANGNTVDAGAACGTGGGTTNPMTTIGDRIGGGASGAEVRVPAGLTGQIDTAVNGATGGFASPGVGGRVVSGTTDSILGDSSTTLRDRGTVIQYTSGSAIAVTLPQAGSSGFSSNFVYSPFQTGTGTQTVTPTTSTINGQTILQIVQNAWCSVSSPDNANYLARCATYSKTGTGLNSTFNTDGSTTFALNTALPNGETATTQAAGDSTTKVANDSFVHTEIANAIAGVNPAVAVQAATAAVLPNSPTYNNGVSGVGATLTTATLNTALVVDGYTPALNDRILVKNQASAFQNGVYTVTQVAATGLAWILTRALDYDQPSDMNNTGAIPVVNGTANATTSWVLTSSITTVGTDSLTFTQFTLSPTAPTTLTAGTSVTLAAPRQYFVCTGACTITVPVPAAGYEFCVMNDDNVTSVITMAAIGSSARYENTARTAYGTAGTGTLVSGGAAGDKVCLLGRDSTHYLTVSFNGTWTAN